MSGFTAPLRLAETGEHQQGRPVYVTTQRLTYRLGAERALMVVVVPHGTRTDLASVPSWARKWFAPSGPWAPATVVHDYLYAEALVSRAMADWIFLEAMATLNVSPIRRWMMWAAVRLGGARGYGKPT